jgi:hypothetical protein
MAGADYLPIGFLDYKNASHCITDLLGNEICHPVLEAGIMSFQAPEHTEIIVPLTAYKGYHVYVDNAEIEWNTVLGRISFNTSNHSSFKICYEKTTVHKVSYFISLFTMLILIFRKIIKKRQSH